MGFGQIQFGGLASGLDTNAIIGALLASEQRPISILESRRDDERQKISRFNELEDLVEKLRDAARDLNDTGSFFAYTSTVADDSIASVSLTGTSALTRSRDPSTSPPANNDPMIRWRSRRWRARTMGRVFGS